MSELARNNLGDEWTAQELRDDYVKTSHVPFKWWVCAFCDVDVVPAAVYGATFKKGPYFRLPNSTLAHDPLCPYGSAGFAHYGITLAQPHSHQFTVQLPEKLVPIRQPLKTAQANLPKPSALATATTIRRRVAASGAIASIANQCTTSLLRTLVKARAAVLKEIYQLPKIVKLPAAKIHAAAFAELKKLPLDVYGTKSNYDAAFHKTNHRPWTGKLIYHGRGNAIAVPNGYVITSLDQVPNTVTGAPLPALIIVNCNQAAPVNRMEARTIRTLNAAIAAGTPVSWCAYGDLALNQAGAAYELAVTQPHDISV